MAEEITQKAPPSGDFQSRADAAGQSGQAGDDATAIEDKSPPFEFAATQEEFRPLDPRVVTLWRVTGSISAGVVLTMLLISAIIAWFNNSDIALWIFLSCLGLTALLGWLVYWRPPRLYRAWGYRIDDRVFETRSGLMFQVRRLLPLTRLQHVDLQRGPLERAFGLASLVLHTAGTHQSSITIPGLDAEEAARLRDHLVTIGGDDAV